MFLFQYAKIQKTFFLKIFFKVGVVYLTIPSLISCSTHSPSSHSTDRGQFIVDSSFTSESKNERIRFLIMHYTALDDAASLKVLTKGSVSSHYLVNEMPRLSNNKPVILQLVSEEQRAWHAGVSSWNGRENINDTSVGIEIVNPGFTERMLGGKTWYPYNDKQINAIALLAKDIIIRNKIEPENVLGHSDISPLRKLDPGPLFPWKKLAIMGIGAWPDDATVHRYLAGRVKYAPADVTEIQKTLKKYGYKDIPQTGVLDEDTRTTISAFQMHFRQDSTAGNADAETESIAKALVEKYRQS